MPSTVPMEASQEAEELRRSIFQDRHLRSSDAQEDLEDLEERLHLELLRRTRAYASMDCA
jgi:hypothetical protein